MFFKTAGAPEFDRTVEKAQEILAKRTKTIRYLVSVLKTKAKGIECKLGCLDEIVFKGNRCAILLSEQELKDAVENH